MTYNDVSKAEQEKDHVGAIFKEIIKSRHHLVN